ncbi:hypothetical protein HPB52_023584 [Rhipicephalus sanguineus]|uniref:SGNH hydrolase-type esterase domain-containing protein n=1 Tax=Rhipicephalus sanguineus TaxID=34632 RepID=A0A9D4YR53_RHISA|nr:hypothetical protein HPB52_023584 [Rhipicephalus sanguineus]
MASTWELLELAERTGLEGPEFRAWYEERMAREREERAAERKAKKEKLESELRAKMEQLEVERRALERRLEVAMDEKTHLESQNTEGFFVVMEKDTFFEKGAAAVDKTSTRCVTSQPSPDPPAFIWQPDAQIDDITGLLDFVPRGTSFSILHIGTNDLASTSADIAIEKYAKLLDYIRSERPDIGSIFATLVLPLGLNPRLRRPNWRQVHHINKQTHRFNCRLVNLCKSRRNVFFIDHAIRHFPPRMVLAADGLHPNFAGVSLLCWNIYNVLLNTRKEHMVVWSDHVPTFEAKQPPPVNSSFAQVLKSNASASSVQQRTPSLSTLAKGCQAHPPRNAHSKKKKQENIILDACTNDRGKETFSAPPSTKAFKVKIFATPHKTTVNSTRALHVHSSRPTNNHRGLRAIGP